MYEVWCENRIIYISDNYGKALRFWREKGRTGYRLCYEGESYDEKYHVNNLKIIEIGA